MPHLTFSVVICTRDRPALLADAVVSTQQQRYPSALFEIIVVDTSSTDETRKRVGEAKSGGCVVRYIYESKLGLSSARNTGAQAAHGDVVVYLDDDAIATPDWLAGLARGYELGGEDVVGVGGGIRVQWEGPRPQWLPAELEGYLGDNIMRLGNEAKVLDYGSNLAGGNLSVLRSYFSEIGGFSPHLGPLGTRMVGYADDDEFCQRIWLSGKRLAYVPDALVYHRIFAQRATKKYLLRRGHVQGMSDVVLAQLVRPRPRIRLLRAALVDTLFLCQDLMKVAGKQLSGQSQAAFAQVVYAASRLGRVRQEIQLTLRGLPTEESESG